MAEEVKKIITIETGKAATSIRDLMTQMEDLSKKAESLDKNTQEYEDTLKELKSTSDKVSSTLGEQGVKFSELTNYVNNYGTKYEDVFKKTLAATAEQTTGLKGVGSVLSSLPELFKTLKASGVGSFTAIKTAIASTGLGLIPIVLGTIIANFDTLKGVAQKIFPVLRDQTKELEEQAKWSQQLIDKANDRYNYEKRLAQAMGKSREEILELDKKNAQERITQYAELEAKFRGIDDKRANEYRNLLVEARHDLKIADASLETLHKQEAQRQNDSIQRTKTTVKTNVQTVKDGIDDVIEYTGENSPELNKMLDKIFEPSQLEKVQEEYTKFLDLSEDLDYDQRVAGIEYYESKLAELRNKEQEENERQHQQELEREAYYAQQRVQTNLDALGEQYQNGEITQWEYLKKSTESVQWSLEHEKSLTAEQQEELKKMEKKLLAERKKMQKEAAAASVDAVSGALDSIAGAMDENSKAAKAMNIMSVIMDSAMGITKIWAHAFELGPIAGPIIAASNTAAMVATAVKSIKQITKANKNSSAADLGGAESVQPTSIAATPLLDQSRDEIQMNQMQAATEQPQTDTRVYVVESDITEVQNRVAVTENNAKY